MASFAIFYRGNDPHSELNGTHAPVASGAAFIAAYPEAFSEESDDIQDSARHVDELAIGDTIRFWTWAGDIDVSRVA